MRSEEERFNNLLLQFTGWTFNEQQYKELLAVICPSIAIHGKYEIIRVKQQYPIANINSTTFWSSITRVLAQIRAFLRHMYF